MALEFDHLGPGDYDRAKRVLNRARHPGFVGRELYFRCATTGSAVIARDGAEDLGVSLVAKQKLQALSVVREAQGRGVGAALVAHAAPKWVNAIMERVPWFEKRGYRSVGAPKVGQSGKMATQLMELAGEAPIEAKVAELPIVDAPPPRPPIKLTEPVDEGPSLEERLDVLLSLLPPDEENAAPHVTAESLSCHDGRVHQRQLAMIRDESPYVIVLCSRRAGKTYGLAALCLLTALARPRQNILYIGLSKPHARKFLWNEVWRPLLGATGVKCKTVEDEMTTTFPNGSVMYVSGTDDVRHIESFLGNRLNLAIIDEAQSQSDSVLVPLTTRILPNALLDDMDHPGKLVMSGTIPEVNAGQFMVTWNANKWSRHNWSRFENPYLKAQDQALALYLDANPGLTAESPDVQREWYGRFVFDASATAHRFDPALNLYDPVAPEWLSTLNVPSGTVMAAVPWPEVEFVSVGIDPASEVDRMAVSAVGWGRRSPKVQHLFEWCSRPAAKHTWNQLGDVLGNVAKRYNAIFWHYDAGSSKNELDTFQRLYGVPVIKAAEKSDLAGQVRMVSGLLTAGKFMVMRGSCLQEDFEKSRWDPVALGRGQYRWASSWHPDPGDAARYALKPYFDAYVEPPTPPTDDLEAHRAEVRAMLEEARQRDEETNPERDLGWG